MKNLLLATLLVAAALPASADMLTCTASFQDGDYQINIDNDSEHQPMHVAIFNEAKRYTAFSAESIVNKFTKEGFVIRAARKNVWIQIRFPEQASADVGAADGDGRPRVLVKGRLPEVGFTSTREVQFRCE